MTKTLCVSAACLIGLISANVSAVGLLDVYQTAMLNDPTLRAARYELEAGQKVPTISRAGLLPNVSLSMNRSANSGDRSYTSGALPENLDYRSTQDVLSLRQPLYNFENYARYQQGWVQSEYSEAVFKKKEAELTVRLASTYFDVLLAAEKLAFSDAEVASFTDQNKSAQRRYSAGEGTLTDIAETDARLAVAQANRVDAMDQVLVARRALQEMTREPIGDLLKLKRDFELDSVRRLSEDEWVSNAIGKSPEIAIQRKLLESANWDVDRSRAGHMPRLDFVASISRTKSDTLNTLDQKSNVRSVGVQLTIPLFSGLGVSAQIEQAVANRERSAAELDAVVGKVEAEVRRSYLATRTGVTKMAAYARAVDASTVAVDGTKRGLSAGIRTNTDVLDAQRLLFSTLRDWAQTRYEFLTSFIKLKATTGVLTTADIAEIDMLLEP